MKKTLYVGDLPIGAGQPIRVESMLKCPLDNRQGCIQQLRQLAEKGCELVRVAFPQLKFRQDLESLLQESPLPLMADIHFDPALAEAAIEAGCPAIRINPGNMGSPRRLASVIKKAKDHRTIIRVGANSGSVNSAQLKAAGGDRGKALALAVKEQMEMLLSLDFTDIIVSAKSTNIEESLRANQILHGDFGDFPFHVGITEAGSSVDGIVKSSCGIALLLTQGIGDTLRVSLSQDPSDEVQVGYSILRALNLRHRGVQLISCPTCGRKQLDVATLITKIRPLTSQLPDGFSLAVMGCEVNGPLEAKHAQLGIAGSPSGVVIFKQGGIVARCNPEEVLDTLRRYLPE